MEHAAVAMLENGQLRLKIYGIQAPELGVGLLARSGLNGYEFETRKEWFNPRHKLRGVCRTKSRIHK